jgi:TRAP-type mannitol/chloroaromatic compound transport system substrate-binding protein
MSGPETVPPFEQLQPVATGVFQMLFTHAIYHYGTTGLAVGLDAVRGDLEARRKSGMVEAIDKHYQKLGLKLVAVPISATKGYHMVLRAPVGASGDLQGRKIRGTPSYHTVIGMLGASPVVLPGGEVYSALEKGVVDGAAWPASGVLGMRWYEVAKYMLRPSFGLAHYLFLMNLNAWNRLTDAERNILLAEGRKAGDLVQGIRPHGAGRGSRSDPARHADHRDGSGAEDQAPARLGAGAVGPGREEERPGGEGLA